MASKKPPKKTLEDGNYELTPSDVRFLNIFMNNIGLFCYHILNVDLLPFQIYTQEMLLRKTFPMLICTRGYSKTFSLALYAILRAIFMPESKIVMVSNSFRQCVTGDSKVVTDHGIRTMRSLKVGDSILYNGVKDVIIDKWVNGKVPTKIITTKMGRKLEGDSKHKIMMWSKEWKNLKELRVRDVVMIHDDKIDTYVRDSISSISDGKAITYDISLLDNHIYISNGFVSHNSKNIFNEAEMIYNKSSLLRQCAPIPPVKLTDFWRMNIGSSTIIALPLGTGDKIRGVRANCVICVTGDTLLSTDKGIMRMDDVLRLDDLPMVYNGSDYKKPFQMVITKKQPCYDVISDLGYRVCSSKYHKLQVYDTERKRFVYKEVGKINKNKDKIIISRYNIDKKDYVKTPTYENVEKYAVKNRFAKFIRPEYIDEDFAKILGYIVAEGNVKRHTINFYNKEEYIISDYTDTFKKVFNLKPKRYNRREGFDKRGIIRSAATLNIGNVGLSYLLWECGMNDKNSEDKEVPWTILRSPKSVIKSFLSALFTGDGWIKSEKGKRVSTIGYSSTSKKLVEQVQFMLLGFGIYSKISFMERYFNPSLGYWCSEKYILKFYGSNVDTFMKAIAFTSERKNNVYYKAMKHVYKYKKYREMGSAYKRTRFIKGKFLLDDIKEIKKRSDESVLYDFSFDGKHRFITNGIVSSNCDESAMIPPDVLDVVIRGFAAVTQDPVGQVRELQRKKKMAEMGLISKEDSMTRRMNQIILASTATFKFNHLYKRYQQYKEIIEGNTKGIASNTEGGSGYINSDDYGILRISHEDLPDGFLSENILSDARMAMPSVMFNQEFRATFESDTNGFFKRSLLEECTPLSKDNFGIELEGESGYKYVMGVDAARGAGANFAIVVMKLCGDHSRIVNCWTTHSMSFPESTKKVREYFKNFDIVLAALDLGGGGQTIIDLLQTAELIPAGEKPIVEIDSEDYGEKLLEGVAFATTWISDANYGLRSDFEHKKVLFPSHPGESDRSIDSKLYDKLDERWNDVCAIKNETCSIELTTTKTGVLHFDLPEGSSKSARKDRYSALLLAAYAARKLRDKIEEGKPTLPCGGFVADIMRR